ncbi:MAG: glycosyltransferase family 39 protein [Patescibacteria group bacterium]
MAKWLIAFIFLCTLTLYGPAFNTYFSQDDFFHFKVSQTDGTLRGFADLFAFRSFDERKIAFYRPITREIPFGISYSLFGLNQIPLRLLSLLLVFGNIYLTYLLISKLFNKTIGWWSAFFVGISSANTANLYYLAGGMQTIGATFFILLCLLLFERHKIWSFLTFLLALGSEEQAAIIPLLLSGLYFLKNSPSVAFKKTLTNLWPHILIVLAFALADYFLIGFSKDETQYSLNFSVKRAVNTFFWYTAWALGLPEMLIDFVLPGLKLKPTLLKYWPHYYKPVLFGFSVCMGTLIVLIVKTLKSSIIKNKTLWFLIIWFIAGLLPVLFLPQHKSTHYLYPVLSAFWGAICFIVFQKKSTVLSGVFVGGALILNITSAFTGRELYWAASRGRVAQKLISQVRSNHPTLPAGSAIYFKNDPDYPFVAKDWGGTSKQAAFVLNNEDALKLLYKDQTIRVFYEDLGGIPQDFSKERVYSLTARISN